MTYSDRTLQDLTLLAVTAARAAGNIINAHREAEVQVDHKDTGTSIASQVVTEVDHRAQEAILEILTPTCAEYDLALLAEESPDNGQRHQKPAFWCIDPMDGTLAFVNRTPGFAVSIALVAQDGSPLVGVVYDPQADCLFQASRGGGAYRDGQVIEVPELDPGQPLVLRTDLSFHSHPRLQQTHEGLEAVSRQLGLNGADIQFRTGAVMNACAVLEHPNSCYFKYPRSGNSGGSLWDYAATACLYLEAGAVASDIQGRPMELNRPDSTFMNHRGVLFAGHELLAEQVRALYSRLQSRH